MRRCAGFTLIELLVVIAIISVLASILFPVFSRAQGKGRQAACIANQKQIVLAIAMYTQDFDEKLPGGQAGVTADTQWYNAIFPYTRNRQIMFCPDRKDSAPGYGMNYLAGGLGLGSFWDSSSKVLVGDVPPEAIGAAIPWHTGADGDWYVNDPGNDICLAPDDNSFTGYGQMQRHNEGIIYGFVDGHVKWSREQQLDQALFWEPRTASE